MKGLTSAMSLLYPIAKARRCLAIHGRLAHAPHQHARSRHDGIEHGPCEFAGEGVLLAWMIRAKESIRSNSGFRLVAEARLAWRRPAQVPQSPQHSVPGKAPQANDHLHVLQATQLFRQVSEAMIAFLRRGPIGRRRATDACGHVAILEAKPIAAMDGERLVREADSMKGAI